MIITSFLQSLTVKKGCLVFFNTLLSVKVCATSSYKRKKASKLLIYVLSTNNIKISLFL